MHYDLLYPGAFSTLKVRLAEGEALKCEAGAMIAMTDTVDVDGKMEGGLLKSLGRAFAGESVFFQTLVARRGAGEVLLAHEVPGEIHPVEMDGAVNYLLQKDGF